MLGTKMVSIFLTLCREPSLALCSGQVISDTPIGGGVADRLTFEQQPQQGA